MKLTRTAAKKLGQEGEALVAKGIIAKWGWNVFNCNGARYRAPVYQGQDGGLINPDLDLIGHGVRRFAEVKTKTAASLFRKNGQYEHGISWRHYQHYLIIGRQAGTPVWLFIYEVTPQEILFAPIHDYLEAMVRRTTDTKQDHDGMAFFYADAFRRATVAAFLAGQWDDTPLIIRKLHHRDTRIVEQE